MSFRLEVNEHRRPQLAARPRRTRSTGWPRGSSASRRYRFPVRAQRRDPRSSSSASAATEPDRRRPTCRAVARNPPDLAAAERLSEQPYLNALLRTTCVATLLEGGHADNALPQTARATVNCRILPDDKPEDVKAALERGARRPEDRRHARRRGQAPARASPLDRRLPRSVERVSAADLAGRPRGPDHEHGRDRLPVSSGRRDSRYGVSTGSSSDVDDVRAHGATSA